MVTFRRRKKDDGSTVTYPVDIRTRATVRDYVNKYSSYWELGGKDNVLNAISQLQSAIGMENADMPFLLSHLEILHGALLAGVNMEGFHDVILDDPPFEAALLKSISAGNGEPISNLYVFDGSKITGIVNTISVNTQGAQDNQGNEKGKDQKVSSSNLSRLARLQFLPISKDIFISLSSRGGFYFRQGNILVPFNRLTMKGMIDEAAKLTNPDFLDRAIERIQEFNKVIASQAEGKSKLPGQENNVIGAGINPEHGNSKNPLFAGVGKSGQNSDMADVLEGLGVPNILGGNAKDAKKGNQQKELFGNFKGIFGASDVKLEDPNYRTAYARMIKDVGYSQVDKIGRLLSPSSLNARIMGDIYLYGYSHGISPDQLLDDFNDPTPSDEQMNILNNFRTFTKAGVAQKDKVLEVLISSFEKANKLKDLPPDPTEFDEIRSGDSTLSSTVRTLWSQWVSPENFDTVSAQYQKYVEDEGIPTNSFR